MYFIAADSQVLVVRDGRVSSALYPLMTSADGADWAMVLVFALTVQEKSPYLNNSTTADVIRDRS